MWMQTFQKISKIKKENAERTENLSHPVKAANFFPGRQAYQSRQFVWTNILLSTVKLILQIGTNTAYFIIFYQNSDISTLHAKIPESSLQVPEMSFSIITTK